MLILTTFNHQNKIQAEEKVIKTGGSLLPDL